MAETIQWRRDLAGAVAEAKTAQKPVVLEFYLEGCPHCAHLAKDTHSNEELANYMNANVIPVRLEARGYTDLAQKYGVRAVPAGIFLSPQEEELGRFDGFLTAEQYLQELGKILGK
ncbi:MAG: thioredoxin family protein [Desulfobacca sp.]|uniref:thioredoxin family protein n=1 Tax=Desulfobacca sp. TaxID=2067990 RepID=UPI00404A0B11